MGEPKKLFFLLISYLLPHTLQRLVSTASKQCKVSDEHMATITPTILQNVLNEKLKDAAIEDNAEIGKMEF